jgi:hypothetical protein
MIKPLVLVHRRDFPHTTTGMSYSNKRLKTKAYYTSVKEKATTSPSASSDNSSKFMSSHLHWKGDCPHMINKMRLEDST